VSVRHSARVTDAILKFIGVSFFFFFFFFCSNIFVQLRLYGNPFVVPNVRRIPMSMSPRLRAKPTSNFAYETKFANKQKKQKTNNISEIFRIVSQHFCVAFCFTRRRAACSHCRSDCWYPFVHARVSTCCVNRGQRSQSTTIDDFRVRYCTRDRLSRRSTRSSRAGIQLHLSLRSILCSV
jgi:hypothetical protein